MRNPTAPISADRKVTAKREAVAGKTNSRGTSIKAPVLTGSSIKFEVYHIEDETLSSRKLSESKKFFDIRIH